MKFLLKYTVFFGILLSLFSSCQKDNDVAPNPYLKTPLVHAGNPRTITLPVSYDTLKGTVTSYNGPVYGYLWSLISGPGVPLIESPSSPVTRISNLVVPGKYRFQFVGIDSAGLTGVDTTSITVLPDPHPIQTLTLQPTNNPNEIHLLVNGTTNQSDPSAPEFAAGAWTNGGSPVLVRGLFKFDLSSIPSSATILSAKLTLYSNPTPINGDQIHANFGTANAMYIERVTSNWVASTLTWATQPSSDPATQISIPQTNLSLLDLVDVDVKTLVSSMVSTNLNYGFKIRLQNEVAYNIRIFCSSKYSDGSKHPKLVVTYQ